MKVIATKPGKNDKRTVTVELDDGEDLMAVRRGGFYRLGYPLEEIVFGDQVADAVPVSWCPVEQKWVE